MRFASEGPSYGLSFRRMCTSTDNAEEPGISDHDRLEMRAVPSTLCNLILHHA